MNQQYRDKPCQNSESRTTATTKKLRGMNPPAGKEKKPRRTRTGNHTTRNGVMGGKMVDGQVRQNKLMTV